MQVTNLKYTRRFNVAQYEFEEITVDAVPAEGQTAESLLADTRQFVESSRPKVNGAYIVGVETNAAPATTAVEATAKKPRARKTTKVTEEQATDTFDGLVKELEAIAGCTSFDIPKLEVECNEIAARFRAINSPSEAASPARKRVVELLVELKKIIDEATPEN